MTSDGTLDVYNFGSQETVPEMLRGMKTKDSTNLSQNETLAVECVFTLQFFLIQNSLMFQNFMSEQSISTTASNVLESDTDMVVRKDAEKKIYTRRRTDKILGCTVQGDKSGNRKSEVTQNLSEEGAPTSTCTVPDHTPTSISRDRKSTRLNSSHVD